MVAQFSLTVNGQEIPVDSEEQFRACLKALEGEEFADLCLSRGRGPSLTALIHRELGWLMYLRHEGDAGFCSRDRGGEASDPENPDMVEFRLSNGQYDEYPSHWCLPLADVHEALLYFFNHGERSPSVGWHDDSE
jgi:hypothetical protein